MKEFLKERILKLKEERRAIILAHNYQPPAIHEIADMRGDSLELSREAASTDAEVIVFCGVAFMAETAAILNPHKIVILPNPDAGCPMADMIKPEDLVKVRSQHPGLPIVTYVNSTAAVKAESTVCCTSANSIQVVNALEEPEIYMAPDRNLALYTAVHTDKKIWHWNGYCPIHNSLTADEVRIRKAQHPEALFLAHPECLPEVIGLADAVVSTSGMLRYVRESPHRSFIIGTENGIIHPMRKASPDKQFFPASRKMVCPNMKKTTLNHVLEALEKLEPRVTVPEPIRIRALQAVERMLHTS